MCVRVASHDWLCWEAQSPCSGRTASGSGPPHSAADQNQSTHSGTARQTSQRLKRWLWQSADMPQHTANLVLHSCNDAILYERPHLLQIICLCICLLGMLARLCTLAQHAAAKPLLLTLFSFVPDCLLAYTYCCIICITTNASITLSSNTTCFLDTYATCSACNGSVINTCSKYFTNRSPERYYE